MVSAGQFPTGALKKAEQNLRIKIEMELNKFDVAIGHRELGRILSFRNEWQEAEKELDLALSLLEEIREIQSKGIVWSHRAMRFLLMARDNPQSRTLNLKASVESALHALELADETAKIKFPFPRDYIRVHWLLDAAYRANSDLTKAEENLSKAISICRQINMVDHEADILLDIARLRYDQKNYEEAKSLVDEALLITERCGYVLQGADVNLFLAQSALDQEQDIVKAKEYAEEAKKLATCDGPPYYYKVAYEEAERMLASLNV